MHFERGCDKMVVHAKLLLLWLSVATMFWPRVQGEVYIVLVEGEPVTQYRGTIPGFPATHNLARQSSIIAENMEAAVTYYSAYLIDKHDSILSQALSGKPYSKLYSFHHLVNGFAVEMPKEQAESLLRTAGVLHVERSTRVSTQTTHTPEYLGVSSSMWSSVGGEENAGEDVVIGMVDTGITPSHASFSNNTLKPYQPLETFLGKCEVDISFPLGSCNGKIVGAQHFAAAATSEGAFNSSIDFDSPLDGDGHGTHTASIAAGNHGVPVVIAGVNYGNASGMAPRARIAVYKALYRLFGGFNADVVAAIEQAVQDGVDILNLSLGPNSPPAETMTTFLSVFDLACLAAVRAGVYVVQAAGNGGPYPQTTLSFSPWITTVAAGIDDRSYPNTINLGNGQSLLGLGMAPATPGEGMHKLVLSTDAIIGPTNPLFDPSDCQESGPFNMAMVTGNILVCIYSFNFVFGGSTLGNVEETVSNLSAAGFVMVVQSDNAGGRFEPIPITTPGIIITSVNDSQALLDYYNETTTRDVKGHAETFGAQAKIGNGQSAVYSGSSQVVALFSSRGPDIYSYNFETADLLKPDITAPGSLIWGAWTPLGIDEPNFQGDYFAMISGTSMATPHVAGIGAILKQRSPTWSPAAINSALTTSATNRDRTGADLKAQRVSFVGSPEPDIGTPFDYGGGAVNATAALDPGLIFEAGYDDYIAFMCTVPGVEPATILNLTGSICPSVVGKYQSDLNTPSITIANLTEPRVVSRTVTSVGNQTELYTMKLAQPVLTTVTIDVQFFTIAPGMKQTFMTTLTPTGNTVSGAYGTFGRIEFIGDLGHYVQIPISIVQTVVSAAI